MSSNPPKKNPHIHRNHVQECQGTETPKPPSQPQYSSIVAQTIQAVSNLLTSVNKDTLIIVIFSALLFGGGYLLYLQVKALEANTLAVERNTSMNDQLKVFIQEIVSEIHDSKKNK